MKHGITEFEWNDYLDGRAGDEVCDRIEAHFIGCLECWEFYEQMSGSTRELLSAGEMARQGLTLEDRQLHVMMRGVFLRLHHGDDTPAGQSLMQGRLNMLEQELAPFCGSQAAVRALHVAAKNSPARSLECVTNENWDPFLEKLTAIAAAMCGESFAGLIRERGQS
jgi:hypothetical protein